MVFLNNLKVFEFCFLTIQYIEYTLLLKNKIFWVNNFIELKEKKSDKQIETQNNVFLNQNQVGVNLDINLRKVLPRFLPCVSVTDSCSVSTGWNIKLK